MMRLALRCVLLICSLACLALAVPSLRAQVQTRNSTAKRIVPRNLVWTNDEVARLRTAADIHMDARLAKEEDPAEADRTPVKLAQSARGAQAQLTETVIAPPKSIQEAEQRVAAKNEAIEQSVTQLQVLTDELLQARDEPARLSIEKKIAGVMDQRNSAATEIKFLETKIEEFKNPQPAK
jgi:hypothetical protein